VCSRPRARIESHRDVSAFTNQILGVCIYTSRSQWPRGLRRRFAAAWLLGSWVVLSCVGRGLCDGLITRLEESYRMCLSVCVVKKPQKDKAKARFGL
jgi:hypothetical protein